jgi:hypothetical protein
MLDKQRNKLNERFAVLETRFSALDEKNAHFPRLLRFLRRRSQTRIKLGWKLHLSLMDLIFMQSHMNIPSNVCLCLIWTLHLVLLPCLMNLTIPIGSLVCTLILGAFVWSFGSSSRMGTDKGIDNRAHQLSTPEAH